MAAKYKKTAATRPRVPEAKVAKTFRLSPGKIASAQRILGAPTATAAIEQALDMVVFRQELIEGTRALAGLRIEES
ncbi:MAG: hypothetical protein ACRD96_01950 [Bryobacteraceae bacterium]